MYKIIEAKIEYTEHVPIQRISRIAVLVEISENDLRVMEATTTLRAGYMNLPLDAELSNDLLQEVAGYGMQTQDRANDFPKYFF